MTPEAYSAVQRARKLLNVTVANGATAAEAENARNAAERTLAKHDMKISDIHVEGAPRGPEVGFDPGTTSSTFRETWGAYSNEDLRDMLDRMARNFGGGPGRPSWSGPRPTQAQYRGVRVFRRANLTVVNWACERCGHENSATIVVPASALKTECRQCGTRHHIDLNARTASIDEEYERKRQEEAEAKERQARQQVQRERARMQSVMRQMGEQPEPDNLMESIVSDICNGIPVMGLKIRELGNAFLYEELEARLRDGERR